MLPICMNFYDIHRLDRVLEAVDWSLCECRCWCNNRSVNIPVYFIDLITTSPEDINDFTCVFSPFLFLCKSVITSMCVCVKCVLCMVFFFFRLYSHAKDRRSRKIIYYFAFYTNDQITVVKLEIIDQLIGIYRSDGLLAWFFYLTKKKREKIYSVHKIIFSLTVLWCDD